MECSDGSGISSRVYNGREDGVMGSLAARGVAQSDWAGVWEAVIVDLFPGVAIRWDSSSSSASLAVGADAAETAGHALDVAIVSLDIHIPDGLDDAMTRAVRAGAGAVLILSDSSTISNRAQIGASARLHHLPTIFSNKAYLEGGGFMSYGPDIVDTFRLSAIYVAKILKGAKAADLPVEQPTKFELVINLKTAKALGLTVPPTLLGRADDVIE